MANVSLIFQDVNDGSQIEAFLNMDGNVSIIMYPTPERKFADLSCIELDIETTKILISHLKGVVKKFQNG